MPAQASESTRSLRARRAAARRWGHPAEALDRDYAESKLADYIEQTLATAPPLTADQRQRLAVLLSGGDAA